MVLFISAFCYFISSPFLGVHLCSFPKFSLNIFIYFIYFILAVLGLCCCSGYSLVAVCRFLIAVASLVVEHGLWSVWASVVVAHGHRSFGFRNSRAQAQQLWLVGLVVLRHVRSSQMWN